MAKYLVTGGAGFIGSNIAAALAAAGERVRILDNLSTGYWENLDGIPQQSQIERVTGDIRDPEAVAKACRGVEVVFHQGALGSVPKSVELPVESDSSNVGGTVTVLDCARHAGVKRVLFAASSAAYGETEELPKRETIHPQPLSPYAVSKLAGEMYGKVFADLYGVETLSLRYFNVFGPAQTPDGAYAAAIPRFLDRALSGRPIEIYGDGEQTRDFTFVGDIVEANLQSLNEGAKGVYNIGGGSRVTLNDVLATLGELTGRPLALDRQGKQPGDVRHTAADTSRAQAELSYQPKVSLREGLARQVEWMKANPEAWG